MRKGKSLVGLLIVLIVFTAVCFGFLFHSSAVSSDTVRQEEKIETSGNCYMTKDDSIPLEYGMKKNTVQSLISCLLTYRQNTRLIKASESLIDHSYFCVLFKIVVIPSIFYILLIVYVRNRSYVEERIITYLHLRDGKKEI